MQIRVANKYAPTLVTGLALSLLLFLPTASQAGACDGPPESKSVKMLGDWLPWAAQAPFIAAVAEGHYYKAEGLDFELIQPANPADTIKLVAAQSVHFTMTYVPDIMQAREQGVPIISVAALLRPLTTGLEVRGDSGIKSPADLKGKNARRQLDSLRVSGNAHRSGIGRVDRKRCQGHRSRVRWYRDATREQGRCLMGSQHCRSLHSQSRICRTRQTADSFLRQQGLRRAELLFHGYRRQ